MYSWKLLAQEFPETVFKCSLAPAKDEIEVEQVQSRAMKMIDYGE